MSAYQIDHKWYEKQWAAQCPKSAKLGAYKCQGAKNHGGDCWCYKPNGSLVLIATENSIVEIKPDNPKYYQPKDIQHLYFMNISHENPVTDVNKIQELNLLEYKLLEYINV